MQTSAETEWPILFRAGWCSPNCNEFARCRADFFILHGGLTDDQNLLETIEVMARPKRFELLTPRFVVWCLLGGSESHPKPAHKPRAFYATGTE